MVQSCAAGWQWSESSGRCVKINTSSGNALSNSNNSSSSSSPTSTSQTGAGQGTFANGSVGFDQQRANSLAGRLNPAVQGGLLRGDGTRNTGGQLSQDFGWSSTAFGSTSDALSGKDKLNKYQTAGLHPQSGATGSAYRNTSQTSADTGNPFVVDVYVPGIEGESADSYARRVAEARAKKIEDVAKGVFQDNQANRISDTLKQRNAIANRQEEDNTPPAYETDYDNNLATLEAQKNSLIDSEFNKRVGQIKVTNENTRKAIEAKLRKEIEGKYQGKFFTAKQKLDDTKISDKASFDRETAKLQKTAQDNRLKDASQLQKENWIDQQLAANPNANIAYLENRWTALNKYDAKGEAETKLGQAVDAILSSDKEPLRKFEEVYETAGNNINEAYNAIKSRVGEVQAKSIKNDFLRERGWDEETIAENDYADTMQELYSGELGGYLGLAKLVKESKSLGLPDEFIASQLEAIGDSENADVATQILAKTFLKSYEPEDKFEFKTNNKQAYKFNPQTGEATLIAGSAPLSHVGTGVATGVSSSPLTSDEADSVLNGFSSDIANTAKEIMNSSSNLRLSDISVKGNRREMVAQALGALKKESIAKGDFQGMMAASAGGKTTDATFNTSFEKGLTVLSQLGELTSSLDGETTGVISGIIRSNNPFDEKARQIKSQLTAIIPNLARGVFGEVGVLTDQDVELYRQTLPNLTSQEDLSKALLGITVRTVQRSLENKIKLNASTGRDMSGLGDIYEEITRQADSLLAPLNETKKGSSDNVVQEQASSTQFSEQNLIDSGLQQFIPEIADLSVEEQTLFGEDFNLQPELASEFIEEFGIQEYINYLQS